MSAQYLQSMHTFLYRLIILSLYNKGTPAYNVKIIAQGDTLLNCFNSLTVYVCYIPPSDMWFYANLKKTVFLS